MNERRGLFTVRESVWSLVIGAVRYFCSVTSAVGGLIPVCCLHTGNTFNTVQWNDSSHTCGESLPGTEQCDNKYHNKDHISLCANLKDKAGVVPYICYCQQISRKHQNQQCVSLSQYFAASLPCLCLPCTEDENLYETL